MIFVLFRTIKYSGQIKEFLISLVNTYNIFLFLSLKNGFSWCNSSVSAAWGAGFYQCLEIWLLFNSFSTLALIANLYHVRDISIRPDTDN